MSIVEIPAADFLRMQPLNMSIAESYVISFRVASIFRVPSLGHTLCGAGIWIGDEPGASEGSERIGNHNKVSGILKFGKR